MTSNSEKIHTLCFKKLNKSGKIALIIALVVLLFSVYVGIIYLIDRDELNQRKDRVMLDYSLSRKSCADNYIDYSQESSDCFLRALDKITMYGFDTIDYMKWWEFQTEAMKQELEWEE
ncbi:MAG: hypothetical protein L6275_05265 [Candidatus Portnoybacteria bacterium]|nr:hypothetical protein [Candidatus Portnoybacteria bacterium]